MLVRNKCAKMAHTPLTLFRGGTYTCARTKQRVISMMRTELVKTREALGLTQEAVAQKARISRAFYAHIELGTRTPSLPVALRIARVLGRPVEALFSDLIVPNRNTA